MRYVGRVLIQNVANFRRWCKWGNSCSIVKSSSIDCISFLIYYKLNIWDSNHSVSKGIPSSLTPSLVQGITIPPGVVTLVRGLSHWRYRIGKIEDSAGLSCISTICISVLCISAAGNIWLWGPIIVTFYAKAMIRIEGNLPATLIRMGLSSAERNTPRSPPIGSPCWVPVLLKIWCVCKAW